MSSWRLTYRDFSAPDEGTREALCTLGNGYMALRGAAEFASADDVHYPGTYLAGCYNRRISPVADREVENEDLVNVANCLALTFRIEGGEPFSLDSVELLDYRQDLNMRHGVLTRRLRFRDGAGRVTRYESRRLVHMAEPHLVAQEIRFTAENWSGTLDVSSVLDGRVENVGVERYRALDGRHLKPLHSEIEDGDLLLLETATKQSKIRIALAARTRVYAASADDARAQRNHRCWQDHVEETLQLRLREGVAVTVEKVAAIYSSRDRAIAAPALEAIEAVKFAPGFRQLRRTQALAWAQLWRRCAIDIEVNEPRQSTETLRLLRLHLFHLLQVASPNLQHVDAGVPARGLHGEAYRGHVFWDELFILPSLTFQLPQITRSLLMYRWYRLGAARRAARKAGYRGAMYPWQSGSNGREETQEVHLNPESGRWFPDNSHRQRHVGLAIAYNVWHYFAVTDDHEFLAAYGAEMILEIARFFASLAERNPQTGRYDIRGVMGPDEYHDGYPWDDPPRGLDNNAYTNVMASWLLRRAFDVLDALSEERRAGLRDWLGLGDAELARWRDCARWLNVEFLSERIIEQFAGYRELAEFDWDGYRARYGNIERLDRILEAEGDTPNRYQVSKQADVLMLFYLLSAEELVDCLRHMGYRFERAWIRDNAAYYNRRTSHGSSLSHVVHAWVLSRIDRCGSWQRFRNALRTDIDDVQGGTTREGIHLGAMAGTLDLVFRGYTGAEVRDGLLHFKPRLPDPLERFCAYLHFRGRSIRLVVRRDSVDILLAGEEPMRIGVRDRIYHVPAGKSYRITIAAPTSPDAGV